MHRGLFLIALAELLAMSLWFSATAAAPELAAEWGLTATETAWLTIAVQLGFVAGALLSSVLKGFVIVQMTSGSWMSSPRSQCISTMSPASARSQDCYSRETTVRHPGQLTTS